MAATDAPPAIRPRDFLELDALLDDHHRLSGATRDLIRAWVKRAAARPRD